MKLADFHYHLPEERIAQHPLAEREASRMLVLHREERRWEDRLFRDLPEYLRQGDCLVLNDSRVFPSRLIGHRAGHTGKVEVFLVRALSADERKWLALVRPGRKLPAGERVEFSPELSATVLSLEPHGERILELHCSGDVWDAIAAAGHMPLPPYIHRDDTALDRDRYQTVFSRERGSVAAPTAGLHFTEPILERCQAAGAELAPVTLHVGLGTFQPLHDDDVEANTLHQEHFYVPAQSTEAIRNARRVLACGTTAVRAVESMERGMENETRLFIYPGFEFARVGAMLTNFHLPESSLLILVCAFAGTQFVLNAYRHAVESNYRFFSYGDCMLIL